MAKLGITRPRLLAMIHGIRIEEILLISSLLLFAGILASKASTRFGIPALLLFLVVGIIAGSEGAGGIPYDDPVSAQSSCRGPGFHPLRRRAGDEPGQSSLLSPRLASRRAVCAAVAVRCSPACCSTSLAGGAAAGRDRLVHGRRRGVLGLALAEHRAEGKHRRAARIRIRQQRSDGRLPDNGADRTDSRPPVFVGVFDPGLFPADGAGRTSSDSRSAK